MKIQYANNFVHKLGMDDPTTCVYHFIYHEILIYMEYQGRYLCGPFFNARSFSNNAAVPIAKQITNTYYPWIQILLFLLGGIVITIKYNAMSLYINMKEQMIKNV